MAYFKNPKTKFYEADLKDRVVGRLHVSLRTKSEREAVRRYAAVETAVRQNHPVVAALRRRRLNIQALTAAYEQGRSFDTLLATHDWPTLGAATEDYVAWLAEHPQKADKTARNVRSVLGQAVAYFGADTRLDAIPVAREADTDPVPGTKDWHQQLAKDGRVAATVQVYVQQLAALYHWVQQREDAKALAAKRAPRVLHAPIVWDLVPKGTTKRVRFLTPGEAARVLEATPTRLRFAVAAGLLAGLRIEEVTFLERADIDTVLGWLYVQPKAAAWLPKQEWRPKGGWRPRAKNGGAREVPIDPQIAPLLAAHVARFAGPRWLLPSFELPERPLTAHTLAHHFTTIVADAGLVPGRTASDGVTFHTLRHTFASWLVMEGVDLLTVARLLGHTTTKMVETTYAHLSPEHRAQAVAKLGNRFTLALPGASADEAGSATSDAAPSQLETQDGAA